MDLMKTLLDIAAVFVTPDWGALVALIPLLLALLVVLFFGATIYRFATAGPTRRAPARIEPIPPPQLHMPGPSPAPILVAFGAAALFLSLVVGGAAIGLGALVLVGTLLLWGREAVRDYQHLEPAPALPVVVHPGPPPGVHMPGPSIRPLLGALGTAALLGGLVAGGWVLAAAVVFLAWTLVGWLVDFKAEYAKVEDADRTGHLQNIPERRWPGRALQLFVVVFLLAGLAQLGVIPPRGAATAAGPAASPGASQAALPSGTLLVVAKDIAFDTKALTVTGGQPFTIELRNEDAGVDHNIQIRAADGTTVLQDQPLTHGGATSDYQYKPLQPGSYTFICVVHPIAAMTGTLTVK